MGALPPVWDTVNLLKHFLDIRKEEACLTHSLFIFIWGDAQGFLLALHSGTIPGYLRVLGIEAWLGTYKVSAVYLLIYVYKG